MGHQQPELQKKVLQIVAYIFHDSDIISNLLVDRRHSFIWKERW